jgi:hypothetical protein
MDPIAKTLIVVGAVLVIVGLGWHMGWIQMLKLGRLPGDIYIERENLRLYIPVTTCLIISAIFALISWILRK